MTIFDEGRPGRKTSSHHPDDGDKTVTIPERFLRQSPIGLPEVSELQVMRHYSILSQSNYSVDTNFYPLGSCTMKYNPRACHTLAMLPGFLGRHPLASEARGQGVLRTLYELKEMLEEITGMPGISLAPLAGAHGEFAGVGMIRAYHRDRGDLERTEILVPNAAHGTNPATAALCGFTVREVATNDEGDVDLEALKAALGPKTAGLMLTNPSTLGVFERRVKEMADLVHEAGGLLYYDGANLNAIVGRVRPGDMGFDAIHLNVHKTFSTPHGGGGPGAGPVTVSERLLPYLPTPILERDESGYCYWRGRHDRPKSMGRLGGFTGNIGVLLRAYVYLRMVGRGGLRRLSDYATLNANYLMAKLEKAGYEVAFPGRRATHEFIITLAKEKAEYGVTALDVAKRLLDFGSYAPTIYFPMLVPECLLIEPTETETMEELDLFVEAMVTIREEMKHDVKRLHEAPHTLPLSRLDETRAARKPELVWNNKS
ncbi:MAG: aminomethyl-transferring glycine dehydrogenase subunit GcvPB [Magnetococcales bacterium]|nr:aminomethyl-transferring glycine dehydrogenase subunit GcvPB [Magnetococcales bacterium]